MAGGLLLLLDDIASVLDDVATLTKVAVKKTSGVLGDDLALNAQQVSGVASNRELPIVWAVAKGSLLNKAILVPAAIGISALQDALKVTWIIPVLLIIGGAYLCFEGVEKIVHLFWHKKHDDHHESDLGKADSEPKAGLMKPEPMALATGVDFATAGPMGAIESILAQEKLKISGAVRTDFILSAEIIVITLGTVAAASFWTRLSVLIAISIVMTVGVYGLVAGIVKLDDLGEWLLKTKGQGAGGKFSRALGLGLFSSTPYLMKGLSIAGTAAMFLVGGGILVHSIPALHHWIEDLLHPLEKLEAFQPVLSVIAGMSLDALVGVVIGAVVLVVYMPFKKH
jgi:predicted DNA repair protein MutK